MGDYGKDAPTGGGIRLRILRDAIVERKKITKAHLEIKLDYL